jgi:hypothetical protein
VGGYVFEENIVLKDLSRLHLEKLKIKLQKTVFFYLFLVFF